MELEPVTLKLPGKRTLKTPLKWSQKSAASSLPWPTIPSPNISTVRAGQVGMSTLYPDEGSQSAELLRIAESSAMSATGPA